MKTETTNTTALIPNAAIQAVRKIAGAETARYALQNVRVQTEGREWRIEAVNGRSLLRIETAGFASGGSPTDALFNAKALSAFKGQTVLRICGDTGAIRQADGPGAVMPDTEGGTLPDLDAVIPPRENYPPEGEDVFGVNAALLADLMIAIRDVHKKTTGRHRGEPVVCVQPTGKTRAIRMDARWEAGCGELAATAVLMPILLD